MTKANGLNGTKWQSMYTSDIHIHNMGWYWVWQAEKLIWLGRSQS